MAEPTQKPEELEDITEIENVKVNDGSGQHIHTFEVSPKMNLTPGTYTALDHVPSAWKYDNDNHWKECTAKDCGTKLESAAHVFEWKIDVEPTATGSPEEPAAPATPQAPKTADNSMMEIWIAFVAISSLGIACIYAADKKRKPSNYR